MPREIIETERHAASREAQRDGQERANEHKGFATELTARKRAAQDMPSKYVTIIESYGEFYVELTDDAPLIRSWERECYNGRGIQALPKNARECKRCGQFMKKPGACTRCRAEVL